MVRALVPFASGPTCRFNHGEEKFWCPNMHAFDLQGQQIGVLSIGSV